MITYVILAIVINHNTFKLIIFIKSIIMKEEIIMKKNIFLSLIVFMLIISSLAIAANYTVKTGDTLWTISQKTGLSIEEIISKNNLKDPNNLYIGQKLDIGRTNNSNTNYIRYTVKTGDLLWKIAQNHNVEIQEIINLNNMKSPYYIYIGQTLLIPSEGEENNKVEESYFYYTVQPGDILWNISQKYGTTVQKLVELNDINNSYDLYVGRKLIIPLKESNSEDNEPEKNNNNDYVPYFYYTVNNVERIRNIANYFGVKTSTLLRFNSIDNINDIQKGDILLIPLKESDKFDYLRRNSSQLNNYYRVLRNDTIADIAKYYNIPEEGIRAINKLRRNEDIYTGQRLLMPVNPALFKEHKIYRVKPGGEYIFDIAFENGISIKSILKANYLKDQNTRFEEGTVILIPLDKNSKTNWIEYENGKPINSWF